MNSARKRSGLIVVVCALLLALVASSCASGVKTEEKQIVTGQLVGFTGPLATTGVAEGTGRLDYFRYLNEHGGINGISVLAKWADDACSVPKGITGYRRLKRGGAVVVGHVCTNVAEALAPRCARDKIPMVHTGLTKGMLTKPKPWIFGGSPNTEQFITGLKWVKENISQGPIKVGVIIYESPWAIELADLYLPNVSEYMDGVEFVGRDVVPFWGAIDTTTEWLRMAGNEPDWVLIPVCGATLVTLIMDYHRLEMHKKGINLLALHACPDEAALRIVGEAGEGMYLANCTPLPTETGLPPMMKELIKAAQEYRGRQTKEIEGFYVRAWLNAMVQAEAIRLAIEKVGLENVTGEAVRDALASITDFDTELVPPITISDRVPVYNRYSRITRVEGGILKPLSGWMEHIVSITED